MEVSAVPMAASKAVVTWGDAANQPSKKRPGELPEGLGPQSLAAGPQARWCIK